MTANHFLLKTRPESADRGVKRLSAQIILTLFTELAINILGTGNNLEKIDYNLVKSFINNLSRQISQVYGS